MPAPESYAHRTFRFSLAILGFYRKLLANPNVPRHVATQLCRAGTSIGANIEEAKSAYSRREMAVKYSIALRKGREPDTARFFSTAERPVASDF